MITKFKNVPLPERPGMAGPGISTKNTEKIPPGPKFRTPRIYQKNTLKIPEKYPRNTKNAHLGYFFGILEVFFLGFQKFPPADIFRYFL